LRRLTAGGGVLVLSGVLASEQDTVSARYRKTGLRLLSTTTRSDGAPSPSDWVALTFTAD